jgi:hypothetical protein
MIRYTQEQAEKFFKKINNHFYSQFNWVTIVGDLKGYVELDTGMRASIKTHFYRLRTLENFEENIENCIQKEIEALRNFDTLYIRRPWEICTVNPSLTDASTFDYIWPPTEGWFALNARYRCYNSKEGIFDDYRSSLKGENHIQNFLRRVK